MSWRYQTSDLEDYPGCLPQNLTNGLFIPYNLTTSIVYSQSAVFQLLCYENTTPVLFTTSQIVRNSMTSLIPAVEQSWLQFSRTGDGLFSYSVFPIIISISLLLVVTWFLTIFVLTDYTIKSSIILRASTLLSSAYFAVLMGKSASILHTQQREGYLFGLAFLDKINSSLSLNILDLMAVLMLQINQTQVIMRLFLRQDDKRTIFYVGTLSAIGSQTVWAVSRLANFTSLEEADILFTLIYLVRLALSISYSALITVFILMKIHLILENRRIWLLSILTLIIVYSPVAFFVADVANVWVNELSEIFSVVTYVTCVVIPWEWVNQYNVIMRIIEKEGVLGRRFYEDELYQVDRLPMFVEEDDEDDDEDHDDESNDSNNNDHDHSDASQSPDPSSRVHRKRRAESANEREGSDNLGMKILDTLHSSKRRFLDLTDAIIAAGFAVPRSASIGTPRPHSSIPMDYLTREPEFPLDALGRDPNVPRESAERLRSQSPEITPDASTGRRHIQHPRRDVFVYTRKEVVLDFSDDD